MCHGMKHKAWSQESLQPSTLCLKEDFKETIQLIHSEHILYDWLHPDMLMIYMISFKCKCFCSPTRLSCSRVELMMSVQPADKQVSQKWRWKESDLFFNHDEHTQWFFSCVWHDLYHSESLREESCFSQRWQTPVWWTVCLYLTPLKQTAPGLYSQCVGVINLH